MGIDELLEGEDITPEPTPLLDSHRSLGYSIEEAVADLIDNSITAFAKNIIYEFHWNNGTPYFLLKDDGIGMSNEGNEFIDAFKLGSYKDKERPSNDLGRFGLGLKTASLSQAKAFTVITKKKGNEVLARSLDLTFIASLNKGWKLKLIDSTIINEEIDFLNN